MGLFKKMSVWDVIITFLTRRDSARLGETRRDSARLGETRRDLRRDSARLGETRRIKSVEIAIKSWLRHMGGRAQHLFLSLNTQMSVSFISRNTVKPLNSGHHRDREKVSAI